MSTGAAGASTTLISTGPAGAERRAAPRFKWVSPDGSSPAVIFSTAEPLTADDEDGSARTSTARGGDDDAALRGDPSAPADAATAPSTPTSPVPRPTARMSSSTSGRGARCRGRRRRRAPTSTERFAGATTLISTGPLHGKAALSTRACTAPSRGRLAAFFVTEERLTGEDDLDAEDDVYDRSARPARLLVSVGNDPASIWARRRPRWQAPIRPRPAPRPTPAILGQADAGTAIKIYTTPDCSGEQAADRHRGGSSARRRESR